MIKVFKALSDPCRIRLLSILLRGEFTVQELTAIIGTGQSRISHHLKSLCEAGLLTVKRQGTWSYYRSGDANRFFSAISHAIELEMERMPERVADMAAVAAVLEERRKRSQEFFDRHACQWDELSRSLLPLPEYQTLLLEAVPRGGRLLEIGVGTGELLLKLAQTGCQLVGVDHSPAMLAEARRRVAGQGLDTIELRIGEMAYLPMRDRSVDCVVANMVMHHAPDPLAVIMETRRVLVPNGMLLIADLARHERESARDQLADQWLGFEVDELRQWLDSAGFPAVEIKRIDAGPGEEAVLIVRAT